MKKIAIVGAGPTGIYTLYSLLASPVPLAIDIFEKREQAGVGMPYGDEENSRLMLANIASIEIPPLLCSYLTWLREQPASMLARFGVDKQKLHERQFLPRILLGQYLRDRFLTLAARGRARGFVVNVHECCEVTDLAAQADGVRLWVDGEPIDERFDLAVVATGHVWPEEEEATRSYFPSPWSGLLDAEIPACRVGIMGTSLSAIDAAMAVVARHGRFVDDGERLRFELSPASKGLRITLMSRSGLLPEADFYCPIPYEPLQVATEQAIAREAAAGAEGLLDRVFALVAREIALADPAWSERVALATLDADSFAAACFDDRLRRDPFRWAEYNLAEVERNRREKHTVRWRYAILRLHEAVQPVVAHLDERDRQRFAAGLGRVFIDNYAAIPPESIRRLLALREAGAIDLLTLGHDYAMTQLAHGTLIRADGEARRFDLFIDARGQRPLKSKDLPFPTLRRQLMAEGEAIPDVAGDYTLLAPAIARGRIAFGALPYLMHDRPFVQGITASAEIGAAIARGVLQVAARVRRRLPFADDD